MGQLQKYEILTRRYRYYIGIDTGTDTGIAIWDKHKREFLCVKSTTILGAIREVEAFYRIHVVAGVVVRLEDARLRTWVPYQKNEKAERGRREGAGSVKRDAAIWEEFLIYLGVDYEMIAPKDNLTKLPADRFNAYTKWVGLTNEHARDAAMLVFQH